MTETPLCIGEIKSSAKGLGQGGIMNLEKRIKIITTEFISGGMEYKIQVKAILKGNVLMEIVPLKVWCKGTRNYVRVCPYDEQLFFDGLEPDIDKAVREEIVTSNYINNRTP